MSAQDKDYCSYVPRLPPTGNTDPLHFTPFKKWPYVKKYMRCPVCNRRLQARNRVCDDGCCFDLIIPRHKLVKHKRKNSG